MAGKLGLGLLETLLENLDRDLNLASTTLTNPIITTSAAVTLTGTVNGFAVDDDIPFEILGLAKPWTTNFGGAGGANAIAGLGSAPITANILTEPLIALKASRALEGIANATAVPSAAVAAKVFGGTGVLGVDVAIGTTGAPGQTPTVDQRISRLTGGVSGTVVMTNGADMAAEDSETLILFTGNTFSSSGILKLGLHDDRALDAESCEVFVTADGTDAMARSTAASDNDTLILLTDTGDCTIIAGSYLYLHSHNATDVTALKGMIRTTGGTIAVTFAA
tara:strand:+ start:47 stop:883 length:837 start_codon:yes stop_codon:yes gene_type:complete